MRTRFLTAARLLASLGATSLGTVRRDRRGATALMFAAAAVPLLGMVGLAVDYGRAFLVQSRLQTAIDAGALAAGKMLNSTADAQSDIAMFVAANLPPGFLGAAIGTPAVTLDQTNQRVGVSVTATLPTTFLRVLQVNELTISVTNQVQRANAGLELALVLDVTGSMATNNRIGELRSAATDLVNILFGPGSAPPKNLWVSIAPYAAEVNIGKTRTNWLAAGSYDATKWASQGWRGCVLARTQPQDQTDTPPASAPFKPFWYPNNQYNGTNNDNPWTPTNITDDGTYRQTNDMAGPNLGCPPPIMALTNDRSALLARIAGLKPVNRGGTMANQGLQAGWFTLSPKWRGLWGGTTPDTLPLDYGTPDMSKAVVLLTDGNNEWYKYKPQGDYTSYQRLSDGLLGTTDTNQVTTAINNRMLTLCSNMKAAGITLFTITVGDSASSATRTLYESCASPGPNHYFDSPTPADLQTVFRTIAGQLSNLRIIR
ncbi:pilus assembly protein TadG-related protein [Azospirillum sp. Marseille-Q6669]